MWIGKYPQMNKGVSKLQYDSYRKTGTGELHFEREGLTHSLPSSLTTSTNQPPKYTINVSAVTDHALSTEPNKLIQPCLSATLKCITSVRKSFS